MGVFKTLGAGGLVGFVVGMLLNIWINPATTGGTFLLVAICAALGMIISSLISATSLFRAKGDSE